MDFVWSDLKTYSVRPDGCDDSIVETSCRFTVNNLPINMTSGNLRRKRMSNVNWWWVDCQDHGGTNLRYFDFNDFSYSEPDIDI